MNMGVPHMSVLFLSIQCYVVLSERKCPDLRFGWNCEFSCNCKDGGNCNEKTGACDAGCAEGYYGEHCLLKDQFYYDSVGVKYFGSYNKTALGEPCKSWKDPVMSQLIIFQPNNFEEDKEIPGSFCRYPTNTKYYFERARSGPWCLNEKFGYESCGLLKGKCHALRYGDNCMYECHCKITSENCNKVTGRCTSGCHDGWTGPPGCQTRICATPDALKYSTIQNHTSGNVYVEGDVIHIKCQPKYVTVSITALTCQPNGQWNDTFPVCVETTGSSTGIDVDIVVAAVFVIAVIAVIAIAVIAVVLRFCVIKRKKRKRKYTTDTDVEGEQDSMVLSHSAGSEGNGYLDSGENSNDSERSNQHIALADESYNEIPPDQKVIKVEDFAEFVMEKKEELGTEYQIIQDQDSQMHVQVANKEGNQKKNKYKGLYPYDHNRVKLNILPNQPDSDYINASYIDGYGSSKKYIAAQGPKPKYVDDFWRMIWELNVKQVVMLTNVYEGGKKMCEEYWPDVDESTVYNDIEIQCTAEKEFRDYAIRKISLKHHDTSREVTQYHFTSWPNNGVPKCWVSSLISFRNKVFGGKTSNPEPTVVHCSAGVGNTGTFIALDYLFDQANTTNSVDVKTCVVTLRKQRVNMVQTKEQYIFLHEILSEALLFPSTSVRKDAFLSEYESLASSDKLKAQYETLTKLKRKRRMSRFEPSTTNCSKYSVPPSAENTDYLPSFSDSRSFIVKKMPFANEVTDFWKLIWKHEVDTVVMLNQTTDETYGLYWPATDKTATFGPFSIEITNREECSFGSILELAVNFEKEDRILKQFQYTMWPDNSTIPQPTVTFLELIRSSKPIKTSTKEKEKPTVVHCLNGAEKSGLYCTLVSAIQQLESEQEVNIPYTIRRLRHAQPQIITNLEQFQFCYDALKEYLSQSYC